MDAFDEIRADIEDQLKALQTGPTTIQYANDLQAPDYWEGYEFHKSTGGWDGHDYMGFVHGELCHRRMVDSAFAGMVLAVRAATTRMAPLATRKKFSMSAAAAGNTPRAWRKYFRTANCGPVT